MFYNLFLRIVGIGRKELHHITAPFDKMVAELEDFVARMRIAANDKYNQATQLEQEARSHILDGDKAAAIMSKIKAIL